GTWIELRLTASLENQQVPCFLPPASESLAREGRGEEDAIRNIGSATAIVCKGSSDIFFVVCLQSSPFAQDCELLHLNGQRRRPRRTQLVRHCCRKTKEMRLPREDGQSDSRSERPVSPGITSYSRIPCQRHEVT